MNNLKYLYLIINTDYTNWSEFYQNIDQILEEMEELIYNKEILPFEIKNKIFWFSGNYFSCYKNQLSIIQAQKLHKIMISIL